VFVPLVRAGLPKVVEVQGGKAESGTTVDQMLATHSRCTTQ
jgi:hypothetical protein